MVKSSGWGPYASGALIGVLLAGLFILGYQIGVSSGIASIGAYLTKVVAPSHIFPHSYFETLLANSSAFIWKICFVIGMFLGAFIVGKFSQGSQLPSLVYWEKAFGPSKLKRSIGAFLGGFLLLLGARVANGCTSGHAISGGAQLSLTSWIFMLSLFATAIPFSMVLYNRKRTKQ